MKTILIQLDTDPLPSTFDRIVAVDAGVGETFSYGGVTPDNVEPLLHGAMFTRGPQDLQNTAIFIGGSSVSDGEALLERVLATFFGPVRVSVMMDSNGSNTTAAAAVIAAGRHLDLAKTEAVIPGGTGPVGFRAAQLLAAQGASVGIVSRSLERARSACEAVRSAVDSARVTPLAVSDSGDLSDICSGAALIIAAGAAGVQFLTEDEWTGLSSLRVAIDANAVPPAGLGGIDVMDRGCERSGRLCYGAIGIGTMKMKIHKAAVRKLFDVSDQVLDTAAIHAIGLEVEQGGLH